MAIFNRRDFVTGRSLAQQVQGRVPIPPQRTSLVHYTRPAMGCGFSLFVPAAISHNPEIATSTLNLVNELESLLTIYRHDSQISLINRNAATHPVSVDERVMQVLRVAKQLWIETDGAFDVTAGPLARLWGFSMGEPKIPDQHAVRTMLTQLGCDKLLLDDEARSVRFSRSGPEINLGGIGKGFALDACASMLEQRGWHNYIMHGGLSSILARGNNGEKPWLVGLHLDRKDKPLVARWPLEDEAISTSADTTQHFVVGDQRFGHILDPRTGQPAVGMELVTVVAPTAAEADALSTAFYVMGLDATLAYCRRHPAITAILAVRDKRSEPKVHAIGHLPPRIEWGNLPVFQHNQA